MLRSVPSSAPDGAPSDAELVERVQAGDRRSFDTLYLRHARYVAGTVFRVIGDDRELDDIVQESFILACENIERIKDPERFRRWVVTIAIREATRVLRKRRRRSTIGGQLAHGAPGASVPEDLAPAKELYAALDRLPEKLRVPWTLYRIVGESLGDTAQACGVSLATVKRRIAAAEERLERRLHGD